MFSPAENANVKKVTKLIDNLEPYEIQSVMDYIFETIPLKDLIEVLNTLADEDLIEIEADLIYAN